MHRSDFLDFYIYFADSASCFERTEFCSAQSTGCSDLKGRACSSKFIEAQHLFIHNYRVLFHNIVSPRSILPSALWCQFTQHLKFTLLWWRSCLYQTSVSASSSILVWTFLCKAFFFWLRAHPPTQEDLKALQSLTDWCYFCWNQWESCCWIREWDAP